MGAKAGVGDQVLLHNSFGLTRQVMPMTPLGQLSVLIPHFSPPCSHRFCGRSTPPPLCGSPECLDPGHFRGAKSKLNTIFCANSLCESAVLAKSANDEVKARTDSPSAHWVYFAISAATYRGAKCPTLKTAEKQPERVPSGSR